MTFDENIVNDLVQNYFDSRVNEDMLTAINLGIAEGFCRNGDIQDGMELYKKIAVSEEKLKEIFSPEFIEKNRQLAQALFKTKKYTNALIQYKRLLEFADLSAEEYFNIASCLIELGQPEAAVKFLKKYEELATDKQAALGGIGEILGLRLQMYPEGIEYLEKYIEKTKNNPLAFNTLGHFYSVYYNDKFLEKQLEYFLKAYELQPNQTTYIRNVIFIYERLDDFENAQKFYQKLLKLNPTHLDYYHYSCFLFRIGNFKEAYKYFDHRFFVPERPLEYPNWLDMNKMLKLEDDFSDKTVLIFHDSGYGDTITYIRFLEQFKKMAKKVILFVPKKLIGLFKYSGIDVEMHSMTDDLSELDYDYNLPLLDLPKFVSFTVDSIPKPEGYLKVSPEKISQYKAKNLNTDKFKIGIAYCANPKYENITNRDISLKTFYPLAKLENVEVYSLQVLDPTRQIEHLPPEVKITDLGPTLNDFEDTAAALMNMDLVISIDNVILNLAGALGVKTIGLFNRFPEYRWFKTTGEDVGWYKSVRPYVAKNFNDWDELMQRVIVDLKK